MRPQQPLSLEHRCWVLGTEAYGCGKPREACPLIGEAQIKAWQSGWDRASLEYGRRQNAEEESHA